MLFFSIFKKMNFNDVINFLENFKTIKFNNLIFDEINDSKIVSFQYENIFGYKTFDEIIYSEINVINQFLEFFSKFGSIKFELGNLNMKIIFESEFINNVNEIDVWLENFQWNIMTESYRTLDVIHWLRNNKKFIKIFLLEKSIKEEKLQ